MRERTALDLITAIRESAPPVMERFFSYGGCWELFLIVKTMFPQAIPYHNIKEGHVAIKVGEDLLDINGKVLNPEDFIVLTASKMRNFSPKPHNWSKIVFTPAHLMARSVQMEGKKGIEVMKQVKNLLVSQIQDKK